MLGTITVSSDMTLAVEQDTKSVDPLPEDPGSNDRFKKELTLCIKQMMFVAGETGEPSVETTSMIEEIVRQQVVEIVSLQNGCSTHVSASSLT